MRLFSVVALVTLLGTRVALADVVPWGNCRASECDESIVCDRDDAGCMRAAEARGYVERCRRGVAVYCPKGSWSCGQKFGAFSGVTLVLTIGAAITLAVRRHRAKIRSYEL